MRRCGAAVLCGVAGAGMALADIPPTPLPPVEPPPAGAPDAIHALAGAYEIRNATGRAGCGLTLLAEHRDAFAEGEDDFKAATDGEATTCLTRLFGEFGYVTAPILWNVTAGGGIALSLDGQPPQPWLAFAPDRQTRGIYRVEADGQMLSLIATFERPRTTDRTTGGD